MEDPLRAGTPTLIGAPYDLASSYMRGPAEAPPLIRRALRCDSSNLWSELGADLGVPGALGDAGDVEIGEGDDPRLAIERGVAAVLDSGGRPIVLGGDHSITFPVMRAVRRHHPRLTVVHVDAHPDLYEEFEGDRFSHACPFARVMEERLADRLVQVGIRTMNGHQRAQAERHGVEVIEARRCASMPALDLEGPVYLSIDLDALDPAYAPGVSHREPGGLTTRFVLDIVHAMGDALVGADVVEYNPRQDPTGVTAYVAAKLVKEIAGRMLVKG